MRSFSPARTVLLYALAAALMGLTAGVLVGGVIADGTTAGIAGVVCGCVAGLGVLLFRRRIMARLRAAHQAAHDRGFAEGLSHGLILGMAQYEAAVFPLSDSGVTAEERTLRRTYAYKVAAQDELPEPIRLLAAQALAALDEAHYERSRAAMLELSHAVWERARSAR
ncbi:hypothetical protein [Streptomyces sp. Da 82-17]|uniref:hypothetical protein n=1 Tax=Streptomyces sp. Da 82-17 TaxID=3377116 RepID=UPI0038D484B5